MHPYNEKINIFVYIYLDFFRDKSLDKSSVKEEAVEVEAPPKKRKHDLKPENGHDQNDDQSMEVTENGAEVAEDADIKTKKSKKKKNKDKEKEKEEVEND